jgi:hypothetical protein
MFCAAFFDCTRSTGHEPTGAPRGREPRKLRVICWRIRAGDQLSRPGEVFLEGPTCPPVVGLCG